MRKSISKIALATFAIIFTIGANTAFAQCNATLFAGGTGTEADPYQISTPEQLQNMGKCTGSNYQNNYYVLNDNIDLTSYLSGTGNNSGAGWLPLNLWGKLNGNGYKVLGLWINRPENDSVGLFKSIREGADIRNIYLEIDNAKGGVKGKKYVGGLVGRCDKSTISNSYATGSVTGNDDYVGGLVGYVGGLNGGSCVIASSYATGNVTGNNYVGGLVGYSYISSVITNSYATENVTGSNYVGGLVGQNYGSVIANSYATGSVTGSGNYVGGLVGDNSGLLQAALVSSGYYDKQTSGQTDAGKGEGKSTSEMKIKGTYVGWDFEGIWIIDPAKNNGYPILFWQNQNHFGNAIVAIVPSQTWTGSPITPEPNVSFQGKNLTKRTDFEYAYSNNIQTGTATLRIVGKGSYSGQARVVEFSIVAASCGTGFAGGTGTEASPYKIAEAKNLDAISSCLGFSNSNKYYELQNDINLNNYIANSSAGWLPIENFYGKFNGNDHKISGLWINRPTMTVGLFGTVNKGADIRNIGLEIDNAKGGVNGATSGGLVGNNSGAISNSQVIGNITGNEAILSKVGGLVGENSKDGTINNSYATGNIACIGSGLLCEAYVGGLVGGNKGAISYSYATANIGNGKENEIGAKGGLVGGNDGTISNSYATGSVTGPGVYVGGLVGQNFHGIISNSYATGNVTGMSGVGGLVGANDGGTISNSYATGNVTKTGSGSGDNFGGLVGRIEGTGGTISNSYFDKQTSGQTGDGYGEGKTTAEMKIQNTFVDWDFVSVWEINPTKNNGYPILQNMPAPTPIISNRNPKIGSIIVQAIPNAILLSNLPRNTKIEVYTLQGKQIRSANSGNSQILKILVQTKGMYIVKAGSQTERVTVR